jgi:hypothetical protein
MPARCLPVPDARSELFRNQGQTYDPRGQEMPVDGLLTTGADGGQFETEALAMNVLTFKD